MSFGGQFQCFCLSKPRKTHIDPSFFLGGGVVSRENQKETPTFAFFLFFSGGWSPGKHQKEKPTVACFLLCFVLCFFFGGGLKEKQAQMGLTGFISPTKETRRRG